MRVIVDLVVKVSRIKVPIGDIILPESPGKEPPTKIFLVKNYLKEIGLVMQLSVAVLEGLKPWLEKNVSQGTQRIA